MTIKDILEEKVRKYLIKQGTSVVEDTVCYTGIIQDVEMPDGQILPMHMVRYQSWVVRGEKAQLCVIYIDPKTEKLVLNITPHIFEKILDDE